MALPENFLMPTFPKPLPVNLEVFCDRQPGNNTSAMHFHEYGPLAAEKVSLPLAS
jgi:hypothetical protein